ncbi:MAG: MarR family winged helix-turn-helix transcriptional regulator [Rhodospirillaceae bacterium]
MKLSTRKNDPSAENFSLDDYPFYLMTRVMAAYYGLLEDALKKVGVDQPRWRVLMILGAKNPSNMSELSERAVIKNSTMTRLIQRMQAQGLVRNAPHPKDNRVSEVYLTPVGRERLAMVRDVGGQIFRRAFDAAPSVETAAFAKTLKSVLSNLTRQSFISPPETKLAKKSRTKAPLAKPGRRPTGAR